mmetsp:Transcript_13811/g.20573  ORF Transcript_13811/g.20573 Transcript_13811/m.20573 type:complete len:259 (+) Transcript_13811:28-804(+)
MTKRPLPCLPLLTQMLLLVSLPSMSHGFIFPPNKRGGFTSTTASSSLQMGIIDFIQNNTPFLNDREDDFIPLDKESDENTVGPPVLVLYAVPNSIEDDEFRDMVGDGMPGRKVVEGITTGDNEVMIQRLEGMDENGEGGDELLDFSVQDASNRMVQDAKTTTAATSLSRPSLSTPIVTSSATEGPCPVLYFSGVTNKEMMDTYNIIANEIYAETNGVHWPACAKVVPPALDKSLRQVLSEISGDHAEAMKQGKEEEKQ